jgi:alkaline phosphatase D
LSQIGRRGFLKGSLLTGTGVALGATPAKAETGWLGIPQGLPTLQLYTDETSAQFRILTDPDYKISYAFESSNGRLPVLESITRTQNPFDQRDLIEHLVVTGLSLNVVYKMKIIEKGRVIDTREFTALDTRKANGRFALVSCMMDLLMPIQRYMWKSMERARPDVIFIIGDASYTDVGGDGTLKGNWQRHIESRRSLDFYYWPRLIPIVATWDDHDYAGNNATKNHPLNGKSIDVFKAMFAFTPRGTALNGPGVASTMEFFGQRFFLMDDRTWRDEWNLPQGLQWGNEQEDWLMKSLGTNAKPAWLLNGSQFFGQYLEKDSFEGRHPYQFKRVIEKLRSIEAPVAFGSGDVHFSEFMRIEKQALGYETFEITSSSMHSTTAPWVNIRRANPRRLATTWHFNYVVVEGRAQAGRLDFRALSLGKNLNVYFDQKGSIVRHSQP